MKYSTFSGVIRFQGGTLVLSRGTSFDDDHPLVQQRPELFTDEAPGATHAAMPQIERATRAPGEVRTTRRNTPTAKKAAAAKKATPDTTSSEGSGE